MATMTTTTRARAGSTGEGLKTPHSISLKVLRLSRPSLHPQYPLPPQDAHDSEAIQLNARSALSHSSADTASNFIISPVLTLPESFRSAYVGEEFACTLCANNELLPHSSPAEDGTSDRTLSAVKVLAEMQLPSGKTSILDFEAPAADAGPDDPASTEPEKMQTEREGISLGCGETLQKIIRLALSEQGQHTLSVTVTYTEPSSPPSDVPEPGSGSAADPAGPRTRTFRKLYQFVAQQLINVKTKTGLLSSPTGAARDGGKGTEKYILEAQLQNVGSERTVCLETVSVNPANGVRWRSFNWDAFGAGPGAPSGRGSVDAPVLGKGDVLQVAFVLERAGTDEDVDGVEGGEKETEEEQQELDEGRVRLGQLLLQWRGAMGERGSLKTSWLSVRRR